MVAKVRSVAAAAQQALRDDGGVSVVVLVGATGVGKSHGIHARFPDVYVCPLPSVKGGQPWFDGYIGQKQVLFDDFYGQVTQSEMLTLCDKYRKQVQVKGGFTNWVPLQIFITSNDMPAMWWPEGLLPAMERRIRVFEIF